MITNSDYVKKFLNEHKIIFPTNIHDGGQAGFQTYGPIGLKIKNNIIDMWRKIFIKSTNSDGPIFEISSPVISTQTVLTRSGHIKKFNDLGIIFYDKTTNKIKMTKRADHFIEDKSTELNIAETYIDSIEFVNDFLIKHKLFDPMTEHIEVKPLSLMFKIDNFANTNEDLYLRPEIAQTIFIEFKQFYEYNNNKLPFGIAQVGHSYRNEISDKPFTRLKEFTQAEVEYFYNPFDEINNSVSSYVNNKLFELCDFNTLDKKCLILSSEMQTQLANNIETNGILMSLSQIPKYISNIYLQMFIFKLYEFAENIGLDMNKIRFRQHKKDEMAHYANDCWDLEANIFGKWLEITGIADRSNYDLTVHDKNDSFLVRKTLNPIIKYKLSPNTKLIFKSFDKETAITMTKNMKEQIIDNLEELQHFDTTYYTVMQYNHYDYIRPSVIEPSIGIDRVIYTLICHNLFLRDDGSRPFLVLPKKIRPYDFMLAQLSNHKDLLEKFNEIINQLNFESYNIFTDMSSTTIGKRYTRADELGIRYAVTIDFDTLKDNTVTVRDSINMDQIRVNINELDQYIMN